MESSHRDLERMFSFYSDLPENRQEALCLLMKEVGFLGITERRGMITCIRRGDTRGVCRYLEEHPEIKARYVG